MCQFVLNVMCRNLHVHIILTHSYCYCHTSAVGKTGRDASVGRTGLCMTVHMEVRDLRLLKLKGIYLTTTTVFVI